MDINFSLSEKQKVLENVFKTVDKLKVSLNNAVSIVVDKDILKCDADIFRYYSDENILYFNDEVLSIELLKFECKYFEDTKSVLYQLSWPKNLAVRGYLYLNDNVATE